MEIILLERIENLGQMGDVVNVKPGYARNYLLPQKKAMRATDDNRRHFEEQRVKLETANEEDRAAAEGLAGDVDGLSVVLIRQAGESGQLYGSVKARDIADEVAARGHAVDRRQVQLGDPIKSVGLFPIRVNLHPEVSVTITANVARSDEEAKTQAKTGRAVIHQEEDAPVAEVEALKEQAEQVDKPKKGGKRAKKSDGDAKEAVAGDEDETSPRAGDDDENTRESEADDKND